MFHYLPNAGMTFCVMMIALVTKFALFVAKRISCVFMNYLMRMARL